VPANSGFSYLPEPRLAPRLDIPQDAITIGVPAYRDPHELTLFRLLAMPFHRQRPTWVLPNGTHPDRATAGDPQRLAT
jgi:hypothetical protein